MFGNWNQVADKTKKKLQLVSDHVKKSPHENLSCRVEAPSSSRRENPSAVEKFRKNEKKMFSKMRSQFLFENANSSLGLFAQDFNISNFGIFWHGS